MACGNARAEQLQVYVPPLLELGTSRQPTPPAKMQDVGLVASRVDGHGMGSRMAVVFAPQHVAVPGIIPSQISCHSKRPVLGPPDVTERNEFVPVPDVGLRRCGEVVARGPIRAPVGGTADSGAQWAPVGPTAAENDDVPVRRDARCAVHAVRSRLVLRSAAPEPPCRSAVLARPAVQIPFPQAVAGLVEDQGQYGTVGSHIDSWESSDYEPGYSGLDRLGKRINLTRAATL